MIDVVSPMIITVAVLAGLTIGLTIGAVVAGLVLMEHPRRWVVCLRLPEELHRRLSEEATDHMCSLKAEIINRLEASLGQPNGDQVVDAPRL
jgi:Arc-like DNA binding domain